MNYKLMNEYYPKYPHKSNRIVAYSLVKENHFELMLPRNMPTENVHMGMIVLGGCLSVCYDIMSNFSIWMMKEYGVQESWTKLLSFVASALHSPLDMFKPCFYSRGGQKVLLFSTETRFIWSDLQKKAIEDLDIDGLPFVFTIELCIESLVSPVGLEVCDEVKQNGQQIKKKMIIKKKRDDFLSEGFNLVL